MNILVTGAKGMVGTALCNNLKNIRDGKNKTRPALDIKEIYEYDLDSTSEELDEYCRRADFVFNLAGVNRPENPEDFMKGNFGFASDLLNCLKKPVLSSRQAITLPPMVLTKNGGIKNQATALLPNSRVAIIQATKPPMMPVPKISPAIAAGKVL